MTAPVEARQLWRKLGALLVADGLLTPEQLREVFEEQAGSGRRLGDIVVDRGWVAPVELAAALAQQHGLRFVDFAIVDADPTVAALLPEQLARRCRALPVERLEDGSLLVAVADPADVRIADDLRLALSTEITFGVAEAEDLQLAIKRAFRGGVELDEEEYEAPAAEETTREREEIWDAATSAPAMRLVNSALATCIQDGASDIHFLPEEDGLHVRARVDGVMREVTVIPPGMQPGVISRLKIMGSLDIAERRAPQDGRVFVRFNGKPIDLRIAVLPTTHGEQIVLRVLHRDAEAVTLGDLGMAPAAEAAFVRAIEQPYGAIVVCGPTGSGKTTTLYAALRLLNSPERTLVTIEDPVEYQVAGVSQVEVRPRAGLTFARGLRTILRSDPDVILVGEIRDEETARIAIQAAMTGHLVLTSLHTQNAASSIERLKDMGIEPSLLASSLNCIVAQRLARRLCHECREPYLASEEETAALGLDEPVMLYRPGSCNRCGRTGYSGRIALYEVMPVVGKLRGLVHSSTEEIFSAAVEAGMQTLRQDGLRLCLEGISSLEEIRRVTGDRLV